VGGAGLAWGAAWPPTGGSRDWRGPRDWPGRGTGAETNRMLRVPVLFAVARCAGVPGAQRVARPHAQRVVPDANLRESVGVGGVLRTLAMSRGGR
jgi:hypothetical protein